MKSSKGANPNWHWQLIGRNGHRQTLLVQGKLRAAMLQSERMKQKALKKKKPKAKAKKPSEIPLNLNDLFV